MQQDVIMPSLGEDAGDECTVSFWHVDVGESIKKDDPLVEMATDKAVFDVPSPLAGKVVQILVKEDDVVKVGQKIAVIETQRMSFQRIVGQDRAVAALRRALRSARTAHAYVLAGPPGVGKMTTALEFAKALLCAPQSDNCGAQSGDACDACAHCHKVDHGTHPDLYRVEPEGKGRIISIEKFRERETGEGLLKDISLKPNEAARKVILIDDAHTMKSEAENCLLKTLEEPDEHSVFILVTPRPDALLETVLSRCQVVRFTPLSPDVIRGKLECAGTPPETARFLAACCGGSLGRATEMQTEVDLPKLRTSLLSLLMNLQEANTVESAAKFAMMARDLADSLPESDTALAERRTTAEWLLDLVELFYRDVAVRQLGVRPALLTNADVSGLLDAESKISERAIRAILDTIEEAKNYIRSNVDVDATILDTFSRIAACRALRAA